MTYEDRPILIAAPARSGTTMTSWLLHLHGVWIGPARVTKAPETNPQVGTENYKIKDYLKRVSGVPGDFREHIGQLAKTDRPWLVKTAQNLLKREAWLTHFPEARWVLCKRNIHDIVRSALRHPGMQKQGEKQRYKVAGDHQAMQYAVATRAKHYMWLDVDKLAAADEEEGRRLVDFCGVGPLNTKAFREWIDPGRWHGA